MAQKEVKIIGLKVLEQFGILQSCEIKFDQDNRLIVVKGEVGSGKTTLQKSLNLGTLGSDTLKDDKQLYGEGKINQEVQLLDGETPIYVGCKSDKSGGLSYVIYTKDNNGKVVKDPVLDGVSLTPASYLKSLQTALTWRMDEITSENVTVQKKILLDLYKFDLEKQGVIFDKKNPNYVDSILWKIEQAEEVRRSKDYARKQIGGFAGHLIEKGYDVEKPGSLPTRVDVNQINSDINSLNFEIINAEKTFNSEKRDRSEKIVNESKGLTLFLKEKNMEITSKNDEKTREYASKRATFNNNQAELSDFYKKLDELCNLGIISEELRVYTKSGIENGVLMEPPGDEPELLPLIPFNDDNCSAKDWHEEGEIKDKINELIALRKTYLAIQNETFSGDITEKQTKIDQLNEQLALAEETNKICDAIDSFKDWQAADKKVSELKKEYVKKLASVNTGVDGLTIESKDNGEKTDIFLMYDGSYDPEYFGNPEKEKRKLSSYSGTQKPMVCLLIQNYLLSRKEKALRYLWIDNVPIDNKTRKLLETMGNTLNLTIFINITGDFDQSTLVDGEILISGGEVFFNEIEK